MNKYVKIISVIVILVGVFLILLSYKVNYQLINNLIDSKVIVSLIGLGSIYLGWRIHLRQKQVEEIKNFYIRGGIDKAIKALDESGGIVII